MLALVRDTFWNNGYAATSVDDLATATGLNRPSLYAAFGDKHALYLRALARYRCAHMAGAFAALDSPDAPLRPTLEQLFDALAAEAPGDAPRRGCFMVNATTERAGCDAAVAARVRAQVESGLAGEPSRKGGVLAALRRSPLVGADLEFRREVTAGRDVDP